ncbi:hypothetical protein C8R43DRAFT_1138220 [Mycena crocata]|nr:hypothetical protein C8R43DRAFT_1138220 [Mycena crocata]
MAAEVSWSGGLVSAVGVRAGAGAGSAREEVREGRKPPHQRGYMHRHVGAVCRKEYAPWDGGVARVDGAGGAFVFAWRGAGAAGGETAATSDAVPTEHNSIRGVGPGTTDADVLRGALLYPQHKNFLLDPKNNPSLDPKNKSLLAPNPNPNDALHLRVVYGADDGAAREVDLHKTVKVNLRKERQRYSVQGTPVALLRAEPESPVGLPVTVVEAVSHAVWMEVPDANAV